MVQALMILLTALTLIACQADIPDASRVIGSGPDPCGAAGWAHLVGQTRDVLAGITLPTPTRVIGPNDAVTMDYSPTRLNISYNEHDVITCVRCG